MGQRLFGCVGCLVGNAGDTAYLHSHMIGRHSFTGGAHAYGIGAQYPAHAHLRRGLKVWPGQLDVDSFLERDILFQCGLFDDPAELVIVDVAHVGEPGAQLVDVGADQWRGDEIQDMVPDQHEISGLIVVVDAAGCIGQE